MDPIARTPDPPYTAIVFSSVRTAGDHGEHLGAQQRGRDVWYSDYTVRIATVERDYRM